MAYKKFFKEHTGYPKFKSKKTHRYSYKSKCVNNNIKYCDKYIKLPKLDMVKTRNKLVPQGRILNATVSQDPSGKYYVSLCCTDVEVQPLSKTNNTIGVDLGIKEFCITSDGEKIPNPKYLKKSLDKLAKLQRELSRKTKGSSNRNKARVKVARLQEHIVNQRKDFLQKLSTKIVIAALSIPGVGDSTAKDISKHCEYDFDTFVLKLIDKYNWSVVDGIGEKTSQQINEWIDDSGNRKDFRKLLQTIIPVKPNEGNSTDNTLSGKNIVITGDVTQFKNRKELQKFIESKGGKVTGSVTSKTNWLINNDVESTSSKNKKARELGIPIISEKEFLEIVNV